MAKLVKLKIKNEYGQWIGINKQSRKYKIPEKAYPENIPLENLEGQWVSAEVNEKKKRVERLILDGGTAALKNEKDVEKRFSDLKNITISKEEKKLNKSKDGQTKGEKSKKKKDSKKNIALPGAFAPFNFIPLPSKPFPYQRGKEEFSGKIVCSLTTLTPFFIRDGELRKSEDEKPTPFFFHVKNKPAIPASSLKGMIRNIIAQITGGDLQKVGKPFMTYRDINMREGYMDKFSIIKSNKVEYYVNAGKIEVNNSQYTIIPCDYAVVTHESIRDYFGNDLIMDNRKARNDFQGDSFAHQKKIINRFLGKTVRFNEKDIQEFRPGKKLSSNRKIITKLDKEGNMKGFLIVSGAMKNKKREFVFYNFKNTEKIQIPADLVDKYKKDLTDFKEKIFGEKPDDQLKDGDFIFYLLNEKRGVHFFGKASLFRFPYPNTTFDFVPEEFRKKATWEKQQIVENMFGFANENFSQAGKLYFSTGKFLHSISTDGEKDLNPRIVNEEPRWLKILASPKPTAYQFYLQQDIGEELVSYNSNKNRAQIAGYKNYWHKPTSAEKIFKKSPENVKVHTQAIVLDCNNVFQFDVQFQDLSESELGLLLFALRLWGEESAHKLGAGKPYGMGTVKINIEKVELWNRTGQRYRAILQEGKWNEDKTTLEEKEIERYIEKFKLTFREVYKEDFETSERIKFLREMLNWEKAKNNFDWKNKLYMQLEGEEGKIWKKRRILPKPTEI